ncbi:MAG: hypothetical protein ACK5PP_19810 [Acidimicrobiales bacterium]
MPTSPNHTVLTGRLDGVGVVPTRTPLTRLNYFDGRFLRAEDLQLDQAYGRALATQINRANGTGVVHGFEVSTAGGTITIGGGLAVTANGRVVHLPAETPPLDVADVIAASRGGSGPTVGPGPSTGFEPCDLVEAIPDAAVAAVADAWVITVGPAEAACGDEDVYGQLCQDACVTDSERSYLLDAVAVRMEPLELTVTLPSSASIPDEVANLRSRIAAAAFATEARRVADLRSRAGLAGSAWCRGVVAPAGDTVPLALLVRSGDQVLFVDPWTVRRELVEPSPAGYWSWRTGRRPLASFLAQVLQFQCQLIDAVTVGPEPVDPHDPCARQRVALGQAAELLNDVDDLYQAFLSRARPPAGAADAPGLSLVRLQEVRAALAEAASVTGRAGRADRRLLDHGIVEAPPAGFLPVTPGTADVAAAVRSWFGEGVDLRVWVARPDVIAQAFDAAQHLDRISLTRGLDDPAAAHDVDVLVPDGVVETDAAVPDSNGLRAGIDLYPSARRAPAGGPRPAPTVAARLRGAGQFASTPDGGLRVAVAASGRAPDQLAVGALIELVFDAARGARDGLADRRDTVPRRERGTVAAEAEAAETVHRIRAAAIGARRFVADATRARTPVDGSPGRPTPAFTAGAGARPLACYGTVQFERDPGRIAELRTLPLGVELSLAGPAEDVQALGQVTVSGRFSVDRVNELGGGVVATGRLTGPASWLVLADDEVKADTGTQLSAPMTLQVTRTPGGATRRVVAAIAVGRPAASDDPRTAHLVFTVERGDDPGETRGGFFIARTDNLFGPIDLAALTTNMHASITAGAEPVIAFDLVPADGVLRPGNPDRDLAGAGVELIAAMLVDRDPGFTERATGELFPVPTPAGSRDRVRATRDWVMFHRRAERHGTGEGTAGPAPAGRARIRLLHAVTATPAEAEKLRDRLLSGDGSGEAASAFDPVAVVEFEGGTAALASSEAALVDDWRRVGPGAVLRWVVAAPTGGLDALAAQRIRRIVRAVRTVSTPVAATGVETLATVPPGIGLEGADGVIAVVTVAETVTTCHTVWRLGPDTFTELGDKAFHEQPMRLAERGLIEQGGTVTFDAGSGEVVAGLDELVAGWGDRPDGVDPVVIVYAHPDQGEVGTDGELRARGRRVADALAYPDAAVEVRRVEAVPAGCPAATVIVERPLGACLSVFAVSVDRRRLAKINDMVGSGDLAALVAADGVTALGRVQFRHGTVEPVGDQDLATMELPAGAEVEIGVVVAGRPGDDPEPDLNAARAERVAELVVGRTAAQVTPVIGIQTFPDVDCPTMALVIVASGV